MDQASVDRKLLTLLQDFQYFSLLRTSLLVKISDYAAQLCGCRSTRQIADTCRDEFESQYSMLMNTLYCQFIECVRYIEGDHIYKEVILSLDEKELEQLLENTLFEMVAFNCRTIFEEYFLK